MDRIDIRVHRNISKQEEGDGLNEGEIVIGRYRVALFEQLGSGSFGTILKATNPYTGEKVAVKRMMYKFGTQIIDKLKTLAESEAKSMKMVRHPNIVRFLDFDRAHGSAWLFMQLCDQGDLNIYLKNNADIPIGKKLILMHQMAQAVSYMETVHQLSTVI